MKVERNVVAFRFGKYVIKHLKAPLLSKGNERISPRASQSLTSPFV